MVVVITGYAAGFPPSSLSTFVTLSYTHSYSLSLSLTHTIRRLLIYVSVLFLFVCVFQVLYVCLGVSFVSYRCTSWWYIVHWYLFLSPHFYPPTTTSFFVSCLSCLRHCHTIPHMMQYLKWHKNKWINEQMKDEQEKPIETLHSCSSKGIMCSAPRCSICNQNCDLKDWCCQTRQTKQNKTKSQY